jgi:hypothetical protein
MVPGTLKAAGILFLNYRDPKKLLPAQGFTIKFQMMTALLLIAGLAFGRLIF